MKLAPAVSAAFCIALVPTEPCVAKSVTLQAVDLTEQGMSTEGGEARLYRVSTRKAAYCRIEVIHFGESGKTTYGFAFNPRLFSAMRREYTYNHPIYVNSNVEATLTNSESLRTEVGLATLPAAFEEYRSHFDPANLAGCRERPPGSR